MTRMVVVQHLFWITSRAAGTAALLLSSVGVAVGLVMSGRLVKGRGIDLRVTHEALSLATMAALVVHAVSLLFDSFLHPSVADIAIPFASSYREPWMAAGVIGGWMMLLLGLSYYARRRIGVARWRRLHRWTALAWALGLVHALGEGSDAGRMWFLAAVWIVAIPAIALLFHRHKGPLMPATTNPAVSERLAARGARIARIRRTVLATAVAVFVAVFSTITVQMARTGLPSSVRSPAAAIASASSGDDDGAASASQPAAVTTHVS